MNLVVGSGPAGISCAQALLAQGAEVMMLDPGHSLEPARVSQLGALTQIAPTDWRSHHTDFLKEGMSAGDAGIPLKLAYGSDFPYRAPAGATPISCIGSDSKASYAKGGLSSVWGSAILPYVQNDLDEWPIRAEDLAPAYRAVLEYMPLAGRRDDLESVFPLFSDHFAPMPLSRQAASLLDDLGRRKLELNRKGVLFGTSRLAVNAEVSETNTGCISCGLCMYGCPTHIIYSSDMTLSTLLGHPRFRYQSDLTVRTVKEGSGAVSVQATDSSGNTRKLEGERVFLAAGVLGTASILLRSTEQFDRKVMLRDSQYFLLPLLRLKGTAGVSKERLHTLSQIFLEIFDQAVSPYTVHLQTYTYNELFKEPVLAKLGPAKAIFPVEAFVGRLMLFQGYLHSAHSPHIEVSLKRNGDSDELNLVGVPNEQTGRILKKLVGKLTGLAGLTGLLPLFPMLQPGKPGRGFHSGGTFPMRSNPGPGETDIYGRPFGMTRIHAVDSTIFPSVPATTITFTVMANAYRIGSLLGSYGSVSQ